MIERKKMCNYSMDLLMRMNVILPIVIGVFIVLYFMFVCENEKKAKIFLFLAIFTFIIYMLYPSNFYFMNFFMWGGCYE